jgi:hypothetical protein
MCMGLRAYDFMVERQPSVYICINPSVANSSVLSRASSVPLISAHSREIAVIGNAHGEAFVFRWLGDLRARHPIHLLSDSKGSTFFSVPPLSMCRRGGRRPLHSPTTVPVSKLRRILFVSPCCGIRFFISLLHAKFYSTVNNVHGTRLRIHDNISVNSLWMLASTAQSCTTPKSIMESARQTADIKRSGHTWV